MAEIGNLSEAGCPSGLAPPEQAGAGADPSAFVKKSADGNSLDLAVYGAKCAGCISKIEKGLMSLPGMVSVRLNLSTGKLHTEWKGALLPAEIVGKISTLGYRAVPYDPAASEAEQDKYGRQLLRSLAVAGFAMANVMLLSVSVWAATGGEMGPATRSFMHLVSGMIAIPAALYAGRPFFSSAWAALRNGSANMDVPISLAVLLALGFSLFEAFNHGPHAYFDAAVMLLFFLLIGRWLDHALRRKARAAARDLLALQAVTANRLDTDGKVTAVTAREILPGDHLMLFAGDRVPVDCEILDGESEIDTSLVTGEAVPVLHQQGQALPAGTCNLSRPLKVMATAAADESLVADLARLVEAGQQVKSRYVRLADKAARLYVPVVHSLAAATFLGWFFIADAGLRISLMNAIAVLIITCPCALGLATPAVQIVATGQLFRKGILVKTGDALERLAEITHFIFDKTGTLTRGRLTLTNREDVSEAVLDKAAMLARASHHPVARAIAAAAGAGPVTQNPSETPGKGMAGDVDGVPVRLGSAEFTGAGDEGIGESALISWVKIGDQPPVPLRFNDMLRDDAAETIRDLKDQGFAVSLLSGDREAPARQTAALAGIEDWHARQTPEQKITFLNDLKDAGVKTAMVGDGLNDAPALAGAHVSLSPGSAAEAAQSAADIVFQGDKLQAIVESWRMAVRTQQHIRQNFAFAALYNVVAAPLAMAGFVTPLIAALAMSGSSLVVTLNALRLSAGGKKEKA